MSRRLRIAFVIDEDKAGTIIYDLANRVSNFECNPVQELEYKPGTTSNLAKTAAKMLKDMGKKTKTPKTKKKGSKVIRRNGATETILQALNGAPHGLTSKQLNEVFKADGRNYSASPTLRKLLMDKKIVHPSYGMYAVAGSA